MELNIGMNIKRLRLSRGLTQEQLAELLSISTAAVSKWEAKNTYPDITMLFPLASIFGVSVDELLGYDEAKEQTEVERVLAEYRQLFAEGKFSEGSDLISAARKNFPHDYRIMNKYMWDKAGGKTGVSGSALLENKEELLRICNCILDGCTRDDIRAEAIHMKAKLLHAVGDTEAALKMLSTLPSWHAPLTKEQLFEKDSPEFRYWNKRNCYGLMDMMSVKLARIIRFDPALSAEEKTTRLEAIAESFSEMSERKDLEAFCICETAVYELLAGMLMLDKAPIDRIIRIREKQISATKKIMALAESDKVAKELITATYQTDDMVQWLLNRLQNSSHPQFAEPRKDLKYMETLQKWTCK